MNIRGKPNARRFVLPNIAAAGRRKVVGRSDDDSVNSEQKGQNKGRARGNRGNRSRGRGSSKPIIVQDEGTLGLAEGVLKSNRMNNHGTEEVIAKLDKSVNVVHHKKRPKAEIDEDSTSVEPRHNILTWASDDDQDQIELYELLKPAFVSDIRKGREVPVVLPEKDEGQFNKLVHDSILSPVRNLLSDEAKKSAKERKSADLIHKYLDEKTNDLMLLQLPSSLDVVHQIFKKNEPEQMEIEEPDKQQPSSSNTGNTNSEVKEQKHCLDGLPVGAEIGKLQLLKNGRTRLVIGSRVMDMHQAIPSLMFETIVQTQTFVRPKPESGTSTMSNQKTGTMTILGNIGDSFLCTYNVAWDA